MDDDGHKHLGQTIAQAVALAGSISVFLSAIHEAGFFLGLGSKLSDLPISVSDVLAQALVWLPATVVLAYVVGIVVLASPKSKPVTKFTRNTLIIYVIVVYVIPITFFVLFGTPLMILVIATILVTLGQLLSRALNEIGISNARDRGYLAIAIVVPISVLFFGYMAGVDKLEMTRTDKIVLLTGTTIDNVEIVRNYAGGILYLSDDSRMYFQERSNIALTATSLGASQWNGLLPEHIRNRILGLPAPPQ